MNARRFAVVFALAVAGMMTCLYSMPLPARGAIPPAAEQRFDCPLWLERDAFKADRPPAGWTAVMPQHWRLDGGGLLHGAPDESGYLKPHEANITKKGVRETGITRWKLGPPPHSYETWLYCGYGPLQLFKRIPVDATECTATTTTERGVFVGTAFVCK